MTEHVHEWECRYLGIVPRCKVDGCGIYMHYDELERRLNATERLSAEDARRISNRKLPVSEHEELQAYADILEEK